MNSSGVVVDERRRRTSPLRKSGCVTTFSRKGMLVFTPRMRNSCSARRILARRGFEGQSRTWCTFTSSES